MLAFSDLRNKIEFKIKMTKKENKHNVVFGLNLEICSITAVELWSKEVIE